MAQVSFLSDLHLFAARSHGLVHAPQINQTAKESDFLILGGDIFDFRWSTLPSIRETVMAAMGWLGELVVGAPDCQVHLVLGNHDSQREFMDVLPEMKDQFSNFHWHQYFLRLNEVIFLHGDVADRRMNAARLARNRLRCHHHRHKRRWQSHAYEWVVRSRLHAMLPKAAFPHRLVAHRILSYLRDIHHGPQQGVRHVYFGHTHIPMSAYRYANLTFHNGGAPMRGLKFRILKLEVEEPMLNLAYA